MSEESKSPSRRPPVVQQQQTAAAPSTSSTVGGDMWTELRWFASVNLTPEHTAGRPTAMLMCVSVEAAIQPKTLMNVQSKKEFLSV